MRRIYNSVVIIALLILTFACSKEPQLNGLAGSEKATITLTVDIQTASKTLLGEKEGEKYPLYWSDGDILYLNGVASAPLADVAPQSKTADFSFTGDFAEPMVLTFCGKAGASGDVVFKSRQDYSEGSFDATSAPLYGTVVGGQATMQSVNAVLALNYNSETVKLKSIEVTANNGEKLAGEFRVATDLSLTPSADAVSSVILDAGDNCVSMTGDGKTFFVVVPAGTYAKGLTVVATGEDNSSRSFDIASTDGITLEAGKVYELSSAYIYKTKTFGSKTWFVENCRESLGSNKKTMGRSIDEFTITTAQYAKINELKSHTGRYYTWYEMMTGIGSCTEALRSEFIASKNGIDDMGNSFVLDGTANEYGVQLRGCCPKGWHIPNCNDWWDLFAAIEVAYCDVREAGSVARGVEGFSFANTGFPNYSTPIAPLTQAGFYSGTAMTIANVGNLGAYLRGGKKEEGFWISAAQAYGWPNNDHMHSVYYTPTKNGPVEFDWYPCSYVKYDGSFVATELGKQGITWLGFTDGQKTNIGKAFRLKCDGHQFTQVVVGDATFNAKSGRLPVRCVKNY